MRLILVLMLASLIGCAKVSNTPVASVKTVCEEISCTCGFGDCLSSPDSTEIEAASCGDLQVRVSSQCPASFNCTRGGVISKSITKADCPNLYN